ncbi:hypothetical protein [Kocuria sp. NPDC057446]|uniref:hypothetical protein n=1 Tax=Kocuria sp. NPDC057446 TaxID=3346137 RepID=UPI0036A4FBA2
MPLEHPIEIKITVGGDLAESPPGTVDKAVQDLKLSGGRARRIWFLEDLTPGLPQHLPMLETGQIFRVRLDAKKNGSWEADATVKLRPARRTQLPHPWDRAHSTGGAKDETKSYEYRIEEDWAGTRRSLAASLKVDIDPDRLTPGHTSKDSRRSGFPPQEMFSEHHQQFLADCADRRVVLDALTALGPIEATRWKDVEVGKFTTMVERWTHEGLDFLELSIQLEAGSEEDPLDRLIAFSTAVAARGLNPFSRQETKTRRVLEHLAHRAGA